MPYLLPVDLFGLFWFFVLPPNYPHTEPGYQNRGTCQCEHLSWEQTNVFGRPEQDRDHTGCQYYPGRELRVVGYEPLDRAQITSPI